jgi:fatty acid synthase subunit alpha
MNRADPVLLEYMKYHIDNVDPSKGETYEKAKKFGQILIDNCELLLAADGGRQKQS